MDAFLAGVAGGLIVAAAWVAWVMRAARAVKAGEPIPAPPPLTIESEDTGDWPGPPPAAA